MKNQKSDLVEAAEAVEAELDRFEGIVAESMRSTLDSQKSLERAAETLKAVVAADQRITEKVNALVAAVHGARQRREERAQAVAKRAHEIEARSHVFAKLMDTYRGIGTSAGEVTQRLVAVAGAPTSEREAALAGARDAVTELTARAKALVDEATADGFGDIARSAEQLRQQLHAALNKVALASTKPGNPTN
jgi:hypothetical protein